LPYKPEAALTTGSLDCLPGWVWSSSALGKARSAQNNQTLVGNRRGKVSTQHSHRVLQLFFESRREVVWGPS